MSSGGRSGGSVSERHTGIPAVSDLSCVYGASGTRRFHRQMTTTAPVRAAWAVAFPGRLMNDPSQIQPDEVTWGPWLVILTRMGATREETTDILERVGRRW
jgi:hypothetical protein